MLRLANARYGRLALDQTIVHGVCLGVILATPISLQYWCAVSNPKLFEAAYPFQHDVLALPVTDIDVASQWYSNRFGMVEVSRSETPNPTVVLERDGARIGFSINGLDASQEGAAILVTDIERARDELESKGVEIGNWRVDERDGEKFQVFFVVAPDGLCYYFHQRISEE